MRRFNHLMGALKLPSNGPLYSNTVIGTLAVDGWAVTFGTFDYTPPSYCGIMITCAH